MLPTLKDDAPAGNTTRHSQNLIKRTRCAGDNPYSSSQTQSSLYFETALSEAARVQLLSRPIVMPPSSWTLPLVQCDAPTKDTGDPYFPIFTPPVPA